MRLKRDECKKLAAHLGRIITSDSKNKLKVSRTEIYNVIEEVLGRHFEEERQIDEKAEQLFRDNAPAGMEKGRAMMMIKKQLAKQHNNFVLSGSPTGERFTEDKILHIAHLVADKLYDDDLVDFPTEDDGIKIVKKVFLDYFALESKIDDKVRKKLASLSNTPFEGSDEWDTLYRKYYDDEMARIGHGSDEP